MTNGRLTQAEADAIIASLTQAAEAAERALRRASADGNVLLLGPINAANNAFAVAMNAIRGAALSAESGK